MTVTLVAGQSERENQRDYERNSPSGGRLLCVQHGHPQVAMVAMWGLNSLVVPRIPPHGVEEASIRHDSEPDIALPVE